jgi:hypothetical protein
MLFAKLSAVRLIGLVLLTGLLPIVASAQSQSDNTSVADAARRAREQKKNAAKPARTLTNDDLPPAQAQPAPPPSAPTDAGEAANPSSAQPKPEGEAEPSKAAASAESAAQADDGAKKRAEKQAALKRAKAELAQAQSELDVLQRKATLDSDAHYSKTDYAHDTEGKATLDADAQQIDDKKAHVEDLKARVAALQSELGEAAEPEKPATPQ